MSDLVRVREGLERVSAKMHRLTKALEEAQKQCEAYERVLEDLEPKPQLKKRVRKYDKIDVPDEALNGKKLEDALIVIAERYDGILKSGPARKHLVALGMLPELGTQASAKMWAALSESEKFESVQRGAWRLIDEEGFNHNGLASPRREFGRLSMKPAGEGETDFGVVS